MDSQIRLTAFDWLRDQIRIHGEVLPWTLLVEGFTFNGNQIHLAGPPGIWKPKLMEFPLSIRTKPDSHYRDRQIKDDLFIYSYRGSVADINHRDNLGLREVWKRKLPMIYFLGIEPGFYFTSFPVYINHDDPANQIVTIQVDQMSSLVSSFNAEDTDTTHWRRVYTTISTTARMHQQNFRVRVLKAYNQKCTLCQLRHPELLDAAHIIGDTEELGDPIVQNGLSLCKIHHAAFDKNIIGINPDYEIIIRSDILEEEDGPMLKYGIQELNNQSIILPTRKINWPDKERLEIRFENFKKAG